MDKIANDELGKFRLNVSRYASRGLAYTIRHVW